MHETQQAEQGLDSGGQPVELTAKAVDMAKKALSKDGLEGFGLRVGVIGGGCSGMSYNLNFDDKIKPDDVVFEVGGLRVMVDEPSLQYLKGMTIDYVSGLHGAGFKFLNPNATRTCGCGSSFAV